MSSRAGSAPTLMALPRDANPYQELLYGSLRAEGVRVRYLGELTPSQTLNVLLLPLELVARRLTGDGDFVHLHWIFAFALPGRQRLPILGLVSQAALRMFLWAARCTRTEVVWTAHNVLPHTPVLWNDLVGRRWLVREARLVIVHDEEVLTELRRLGLHPRRTAIIPHGPIPLKRRIAEITEHGGPRRLLFFGRVAEYKGVAELLEACAKVRENFEVVIAGQCEDPALRRSMEDAAWMDHRIRLDLRRLPDSDLSNRLEQADVVVLPFRRISTSGSVMLATDAGRPLVIPALPALLDVPDEACFRYDGSVPGLAQAIESAVVAPVSHLRAMGRAGRMYAQARSWDRIARQTLNETLDALDSSKALKMRRTTRARGPS